MPADTHQRILDAALTAMTSFGIAKLTLEDVAGAADVSRQTVYRYFGSKDELIRACLLREEQRFLDAVLLDVTGEPLELRLVLERTIASALRHARAHPLLDRLLETEPETMLPLLLTGEGPVLSVVGPAIERVLRERLCHLTDRELQRLGDATARLLISYAINPPSAPIDEVAAGLAELIVHGVKTDEPSRTP